MGSPQIFVIYFVIKNFQYLNISRLEFFVFRINMNSQEWIGQSKAI